MEEEKQRFHPFASLQGILAVRTARPAAQHRELGAQNTACEPTPPAPPSRGMQPRREGPLPRGLSPGPKNTVLLQERDGTERRALPFSEEEEEDSETLDLWEPCTGLLLETTSGPGLCPNEGKVFRALPSLATPRPGLHPNAGTGLGALPSSEPTAGAAS